MQSIIFPLQPGDRPAIANLQDALQLFLDRGVITEQPLRQLLQSERATQVAQTATIGLIQIFQQQKLPGQPLESTSSTSIIGERTAKAMNDILRNLGALEIIQIAGKISSPTSTAVGALFVTIVDKTIGEDILLATVRTRSDGSYSLTLENTWLQRGKTQPDLQARIFTISDNTTDQDLRFLAASEVRYNASPSEILNVILPANTATALPAEHTTLLQNLATHFQGNLRDLQETDTRQDITYLANKSGWDARAVAIAALSDQFSVRSQESTAATGATIDPAFFYTLFRAGLPANEDAVYKINAKTVETVWKQGIEQGLIPAALEAQLPQALDRFKNLAAQRTLDAPAVNGVSSLKEMLSTSRITDLTQQQQFVRLYAQHQDNLPQFWESVQRDFGAPIAQRLRVDGQLGFLTLNNAPLIQKLHQSIPGAEITNPITPIENGYYRVEQWQTLLTDDIAIPAEIPGTTPDEKRRNYAEVMAAQMRLSYPTAVVAQMVGSGETLLSKIDNETPANNLARRQLIRNLLTASQGKFEIGLQPIEQYANQNNLPIDSAVKEIARIQRVRQITPSDEAMNALLSPDLKLDSAYKITQYDRTTFVQQFQAALGGETNAILTHAKAQQVHNTVLNIATAYLTGRNAPAIGSNLTGRIINSQTAPPEPATADTSDIIAYPTLEKLFDEMDYCTCDHCRSILSPAAYLVNLLQFCDRPEKDINNLPAEQGDKNPQSVLFKRRPDIQHLPLTCENTNTPLPYIDIVNETLEYFVTHNQNLENYTGHDIDRDVTPEELLASPQFVSDRAYETLAGKPPTAAAPLPLLPPSPPLPFHQPLENLRRYFDKFDTPLPQIMRVLRKNDALERTAPDSYGWRDILMEELRISRAEYRLLTDRTLTIQQLYGYSPTTPETEILATLANAKTFTRRIGISYEDLIEIIKTRFVNPNAVLIPKLERLNIPFKTLKALKDGTIADADFDALIPPGLNPTPYGGNIKAWVRSEAIYPNITSLITLTNPTAVGDPCSFDRLELRYSNPDNDTNRLRPFEFIRLLRFIRLWKKLGWTIAQTDQAIIALNPRARLDSPNDANNLGSMDAGFLTLLPRLGVIKQVMDRLQLQPQKDLLPLLACFAPIDTYGRSLYHQMFLSPALLKQDPVSAEDGFGNVLRNPAQQKIGSHIEVLRAALQLTDEELRQIMANLSLTDETPLTLANLSAIFRRGWLARKLKLSVREFLLLTQFTGLDPFAATDPFIPVPQGASEPPDPINPPIQGLIELVQQLRALSLKPSQALYLIWNQDVSGKSIPNNREIIDFARSLRIALTAIDNEYTLTDDPDGQIARAKMALVYDNDTTDLFFGLLGNTLVTTVENYSHNQANLEPTILAVAPDRITYDDFRKQLSFKGIMTATMRDALKAINGVSPEFLTAIDTLYAENQKVIQPFFTRYPELRSPYEIYIASNASEEEKRSTLLANFLPELKRRRKQQQVLQSISAATKVEAQMADALLTNESVLHALNDPQQPAFNDPISIETSGLSAQFFFRNTATGDVDISLDAVPNLAYSQVEGQPLPENTTTPNTTISGIWSGYLEAPENGFFNFSIEADTNARVSLNLGGKLIDLTHTQNSILWRNAQPIDLRAGTLCEIALKVENVKDTLKVRWQTSGRGLEVIPAAYLYSSTLISHLRLTYIRFLKVTALATTLKLTASEIAYLAVHTNYRISGQGWLNSLPVNGSPAIATAIALRRSFTALLDFAHLKSELSPDDERLLTLLKDPAAAAQPDGSESSLFSRLTRWEERSRDALLSHFGMAIGDLTDPKKIRRLFHAYEPLKALGISASASIGAATNEPNAITVRNLQSALRARYSESDWLNVLKPINDDMRELQRDALVAYILHQMRQNVDTQQIDTPDKLFEYFLMDVQMAPCMQTSRIRHALSSIQLFIERCLMNLETKVSPSSINAKQWAWMKRYRVWEANRKVFLYPENWLEPELRDDQSPFFKEAMSELLQGDITEDRAAVTLLNYLSKLEEVAKLEPCGIHFVENAPSKLEDDVAHVVARTAGANRKYFYRRREFGNWTPWEQIKLDIEDNPVIPVVWNDRLFLFWLRIIKQAPLGAETMANSLSRIRDGVESIDDDDIDEGNNNVDNNNNGGSVNNSILDKAQKRAEENAKNLKISVRAVLCWSEYYNGKWQGTKTSDINKPTNLGKFPVATADSFDRSQLKLSILEDSNSNTLRIYIFGTSIKLSSFLLYNTHSLPIRGEDVGNDLSEFVIQLGISFSEQRSLEINKEVNNQSLNHQNFDITYARLGSNSFKKSIFKSSISANLTSTSFRIGTLWNAPFFYEDSRHVFYVSTKERSLPVPVFPYYGWIDPPTQVFQVEPVVEPPQPPIRDRSDFAIVNQQNTTLDTASLQRFVTEDAYIKKGIAIPGTIRYGDKDIGLTGTSFKQVDQ